MNITNCFELNSLTETQLGDLVASLPENWGYLDGHLHAPENPTFHVALRTRLVMQNRDLVPRLIGIEEEKEPQVLAIYTRNASPKVVEFRRAGDQMYSGALTLRTTLDLAAHYVRLGYTGNLRLFLRDGRDNCMGQNPNRKPLSEASIHLGSWEDGEQRLRQPMLELSFDPNHSDGKSSIFPIFSLCYGMKRIGQENLAPATT